MKTYQQTLEFLYAQLPTFHREGKSAYKPGLGNIESLLSHLGNPHLLFKSIHIAGTNGKGSTSHSLACVLQVAGYKTGLYTSPHLKDFSERIRIDGETIDNQSVIDFVFQNWDFIHELKPSFFEVTVAMAFEYFAKQNVEIAVIEVGLGGRLDSTNVITPILSIITNIGWDHSDLLGDTLQKIASEKAGIIKRGVPVVISETQSELKGVFIDKAKIEGAEISFAEDNFNVTGVSIVKNSQSIQTNHGVYVLQLLGSYQQKNLLGILESVRILRHQGFRIGENTLLEGLSTVVDRTGLKGRWQILGHDPIIVADTAHNEPGLKETLGNIKNYQPSRIHFILGFSRDKDLSKIIDLFPLNEKYYFTQYQGNRSLESLQLQAEFSERGIQGTVVSDVNSALKLAKEAASPKDFIFIGGSIFLVAEIDGI